MTKTKLEQYRARQAERIEAMSRAIDDGRTTVVQSVVSAQETQRYRICFLSERRTAQKFIFGLCGVGRRL